MPVMNFALFSLPLSSAFSALHPIFLAHSQKKKRQHASICLTLYVIIHVALTPAGKMTALVNKNNANTTVLCNKQVRSKDGNTTNLHLHLKTHHPTEYTGILLFFCFLTPSTNTS